MIEHPPYGACTPVAPGQRQEHGRIRSRAARPVPIGLLVCIYALTACSRPGPRPSVVLVVLDTTRADAVSAYGQVAGTTPSIDALAETGLLYDHAYSNANWTLPAHATLFTGLLPSQHGVRRASDVLQSFPTLAALLQRSGYETVGFSENPWLGPQTGTSAGFERFDGGGGVVAKVGKWLQARQSDRPFFLFINFMDPHEEYTVRQTNPFLPAGVTAEEARHVPQKPENYLCATKEKSRELAVLHGLYLGDVQAADAKLAKVLALLAPMRAAGSVIVVVASDHGEYFGEQQLVGHIVGLHEAVLHIPLIVHGLPGVASGRVTTPVQLADLMPSVLQWARAPVPAGLAGRLLPTNNAAANRDRAIVAESYDYLHGPLVMKGDDPGQVRATAEELWQLATASLWRQCGPDDRVNGDMRALIQFPYKLEWYANYAPQLFDLGKDPSQQADLGPTGSDELTKLQAELQEITTAAARPTQQPARELDQALLERVRALGYLDGATTPSESRPTTPSPLHGDNPEATHAAHD